MGAVRLYVFDSYGQQGCTNPNGCYNTGRMDPSKPSGQQCIDPDPQFFTSMQDLLAYAGSRGESIQQTTREQVNQLCSGNVVDAGSSPPGCDNCGSGSGSGSGSTSYSTSSGAIYSPNSWALPPGSSSEPAGGRGLADFTGDPIASGQAFSQGTTAAAGAAEGIGPIPWWVLVAVALLILWRR